MFCSNCGSLVQDGDKFCEACGARLAQPAESTQPVQPVQAVVEPVVESPVRAPKKKKFPVIIAVILAAALVIGAVAAVLILTAKETVYLVTEHVNENMNGLTTIQRYEYDEDGRLISYEVITEYPKSYGIDDQEFGITYKYDKDGKLAKAELESNDETVVVEYIYEKGVLTDLELDADEFEWDVEIDENGRIEQVEILDEDGETAIELELKYHENGVLKKYTEERDTVKTVNEYNEDGQVIESATYLNGELMQKTVTECDDNGYIRRREIIYNDDSSVIQEYEYSLDENDQLSAFSMIITMREDGEKQTVEMSFDVEWDGTECTMTVDEIDGPDEVMDDMPPEMEEMEIIVEMDEAGNLLGYSIEMDGEAYISVSTEYQEMKLPKDYKMPNIQIDPLYMSFLLGR